MKPKPFILEYGEEKQNFFAKLARLFKFFKLERYADYCSSAEGDAIDEIILWHECTCCGKWFRDTNQLLGVCEKCRVIKRPCPECGREYMVVDWLLSKDPTRSVDYFATCECGHQYPEGGCVDAKSVLEKVKVQA